MNWLRNTCQCDSRTLLRSDNIIASTWIHCVDCGHEDNLNGDLQTCVIQCRKQDTTPSTCLQKRFQGHYPRRQSEYCDGALNKIMWFDLIPKILVCSVSEQSIQVSKKIRFCDGDSLVVSGLKGIAYYGDFHHTASVCRGGSVCSMMAWSLDGNVHMKRD